MERKDLLHHCRYYKGERKCPFQGTKEMLWGWEKAWIKMIQSEDEKDSEFLSKALEDYILAGLSDFEKYDDIPLTLKAILYNRFDHWNGGGGFKLFYLRYYNEDIMVSEQSFVRLCRYYRGEDDCPQGVSKLLWGYEKSWVEFNLRASKFGNGADADYLKTIEREYNDSGLRYFEMMDDTPASLKALLFNRFCHWDGGSMRHSVEPFKKWYLSSYIGKEPDA